MTGILIPPYSATDDDGTVYAIEFYDPAYRTAPFMKVGYTARPVALAVYRASQNVEAHFGFGIDGRLIWDRPGSLRLEIYLQSGLSFDYPTINIRRERQERKREAPRHPEWFVCDDVNELPARLDELYEQFISRRTNRREAYERSVRDAA